jgi:molecular chaperone HscB
MQLTTRVNEAYRALKDPVLRAKHLLELNGVDVAFETNTQMPTDFLTQQLEMREELEAAVGKKDSSFLDGLRKKLASQEKRLEGLIGESIDGRQDYAGAVELVRKLLFLHKIEEEIQSAYDTIE